MNPYRTGTVKRSVFAYLDWLAEDQDLATIDVTHITQAYSKIARKLAQELLDEWKQARARADSSEEQDHDDDWAEDAGPRHWLMGPDY